jgi:hypothetical protein
MLFIGQVQVVVPFATQARGGLARVDIEDIHAAATRIAGWQRAVEDFVAHGGASHHIAGLTDPQGVHGELARDEFAGALQNIANQLPGSIQRPAAKAIPVEANLKQRFGAFTA